MPPEPASVATEVPPADPGRLREIFVAHHRFIWRLLRRFGLPTEAADDLTRDAVVQVSHGFRPVTPVGSLMAFFGGRSDGSFTITARGVMPFVG